MSLFYNPFLRMNSAAISKLIENGTPYVVIQRFEWPGVPRGKGFLVCAYRAQHEAEYHARELEPTEGKMQNLLEEKDQAKMIALSDKDSGYFLFFNGTVDLAQDKSLKKAFVKSVHGYIRYIRMPKEDEYHVRIFVEHGRVKATITSGPHRHTALFYNMIK
jgi:hypothetical protein